MKQIRAKLFNTLTLMLLDLKSNRFWSVLFIEISNIIPDFLFAGLIRSLIWKILGTKIKELGTCLIRKGNFTENPKNLSIGKNFILNRNCYLDTNGMIEIGDYVRISHNVNILTVSHKGRRHEIDEIKKVTIKSNSIIYAGCILLPGSTLEQGTVLAAGSVLKGKTKPWALYAGTPAKFKRYLKK